MRLADNLAAGTGWSLSFQELADPIGIAVSGGGDSMGLLFAMHDWAKKAGREVRVATVDHRLRAESRDEADFVAQTCEDLNVSHDTLTLDQLPGGNLQAAARQARYDLLGSWAKGNSLACVLLGHTQDDQAETFLLRLARGSGVDGLAAMQDHKRKDGVLFIRPLLETSRASIRDYLTNRGQRWIDDPSNEDMAYDRVKARAVLSALEPLGLGMEQLNKTAFRMSTARDALETIANDVAKDAVQKQGGDLVIDLASVRQAPYETQLRIVSAGLCCVSSNPYRPRLYALADLLGNQSLGKAQTLHGALVSGDRTTMRITREFNAVKDAACSSTDIWDNRWAINGPHAPILTIRALGESLKDVPDWRATGLPRTSLMASPAVFDGETLISAPVAGLQNGFNARIVADFESFLLSR